MIQSNPNPIVDDIKSNLNQIDLTNLHPIDGKAINHLKTKLNHGFIYRHIPAFKELNIFQNLPRNLLLYGPAGSQIEVAKYVAKTLLRLTKKNVIMFMPKLSFLLSKWPGRSGYILHEMNNQVRAKAADEDAMVVVFLDELETVVKHRETFETDIPPLLRLLDNDTPLPNGEPDVIVIGATTRPYQLNVPVRRCFGAQIFIDLPSLEIVEREIINFLRGMFDTPIKTELTVYGEKKIVPVKSKLILERVARKWAKYCMANPDETASPALSAYLRKSNRIDPLGQTTLGYTLSDIRRVMVIFRDWYFHMVIFEPQQIEKYCFDKKHPYRRLRCTQLYDEYNRTNSVPAVALLDDEREKWGEEWDKLHCTVDEKCSDHNGQSTVCSSCLEQYVPQRLQLYRIPQALIHLNLEHVFLDFLKAIEPSIRIEMYTSLVQYSKNGSG